MELIKLWRYFLRTNENINLQLIFSSDQINMPKRKNQLSTEQYSEADLHLTSVSRSPQVKQANEDLFFDFSNELKMLESTLQPQCDGREPAHKKRGRIEQKKWQKSETKKLYSLHNDMGNKWKQIAAFFPDRSCNSIKNRFFSNLRLSLRELNRQITKNIGPKKQIKLPILYKILSVCEEKFDQNSKYEEQAIKFALNLKNNILFYFDQCKQSGHESQKLITQIKQFEELISSCQKKYTKKLSQLIQNQQLFVQNNEILKRQSKAFLNDQASICNNSIANNIWSESEMKPEENNNITSEIDLQRQLGDDVRNHVLLQQEYIQKPAIFLSLDLDKYLNPFLSQNYNIPQNKILSLSQQDQIFNLNHSDDSYFSQNQNVLYFSEFLNENNALSFLGTQHQTL